MSGDLRLEMLERHKAGVEAGDGHAVLEALALAASLNLPMPVWLSSAVTSAVATYQNHDAKTLDEAFGVSRPKGQQKHAVRSEGRNAMFVIAEVLRLHARGVPIGPGIFERAGETCAVGKTTAQEWYYKHKNGRTPTYLVAMQMAGLAES